MTNKGFTLIELMVAITIVAILATIGIIAFSGAQRAARDAKRKGDLDDIKKALYLYRASAGTFCVSKAAASCSSTVFGTDVSSATNGWAGSAPNNNLSVLAQYLKGGATVVDPNGTYAGDLKSNYYVYINSDDTFTLSARLEGTPPSNGCTVTDDNSGGVGRLRNYCITQ